LLATVLVDVCYRLYADIEADPSNYQRHGGSEKQRTGTTNGGHAYKEMFDRRLERGQFFSIPCLEIRPGTWVFQPTVRVA
jgi:CRISPR-associated protein Cas5d